MGGVGRWGLREPDFWAAPPALAVDWGWKNGVGARQTLEVAELRRGWPNGSFSAERQRSRPAF